MPNARQRGARKAAETRAAKKQSREEYEAAVAAGEPICEHGNPAATCRWIECGRRRVDAMLAADAAEG